MILIAHYPDGLINWHKSTPVTEFNVCKLSYYAGICAFYVWPKATMSFVMPAFYIKTFEHFS